MLNKQTNMQQNMHKILHKICQNMQNMQKNMQNMSDQKIFAFCTKICKICDKYAKHVSQNLICRICTLHFADGEGGS